MSHGPIDTLELDPAGSVGINLSDPGSSYFIDSDLDELDAPGEWMWQAATLYLYPPAWEDPGTMQVTVVTTTSSALLVDHDDAPVGLDTGGASLSGLHFTRSYGAALAINGPASVESCSFSELDSVVTGNSTYLGGTAEIFSDGFEAGDLDRWSSIAPQGDLSAGVCDQAREDSCLEAPSHDE